MDTGLTVTFPLNPPSPLIQGEDKASDRLKVRQKDPVCKQVVMKEGYEVNSCLKYMAISLREDVRKASLTPYVAKTLKSESEHRSWKIASYRCVEDDMTDMRSAQAIVEGITAFRDRSVPYDKIGNAYYCQKGESLSLELLSDDIDVMDVFLCDPDPTKTFDTIPLQLPPLRSVPEGKEIMVFYDRDIPTLDDEETEETNESPEPVAKKAKSKGNPLTGPNVALNPTAMERGASTTVNNLMLSPQECAVYVKRGGKWHVRYKMVQRGEHFNPNPLLRLSGPLVVSKTDQLQLVPDDGEFFLNQTIIKNLYGKKVKEHQQQYSEDSPLQPLLWDYLLSNKASKQLEKLDRAASEQAVLQAEQAQMEVDLNEMEDDSDESTLSIDTDYSYHFFFERWNSCHSIGVFCHVTDSQVYLYLHETEGAGNATSKRIRAKVFALMQKLHPDKQLMAFYPHDMLQKDFASCGVFAMKAMNYFRKHPVEMVDWLSRMHQSDLLEAEEDSKATGEALEQPELMEHAIAFKDMPAGLLKMFNGRLVPTRATEPVFTDEQLDTVVNKKGETLREYLWKYEASDVEKPDGGTTTVNVGTTAKRLEYFAKYEQFMKENHAYMRLGRKRVLVDEDKGFVAYPFQVLEYSLGPPATKLSRSSLSKAYHGAPAWVLNSDSLEAVNEWLVEQGAQTVSQAEWGYVGDYFNFAANDRNLDVFLKKYPKAAAWFMEALDKPLTDAKWFLVNHWYNDGITGLPPEFKKQYAERTVKKVPKKIRKKSVRK
ncbi:hypothetical protein [Endozoicomonas arenosclerae]|uniref:hypothetical protein n=1 Tax=Endozoicomonas arenosclerae TaxID=1633495 RepID=UPI000B160ABC|nr:hypothetical protein [Endozoicomonas arenosclerae]